jgi:DNA mismatch repair ATPase MutS
MEIDKTTLSDLSLIDNEGEFSVFHHLNLCRTIGGRDQLFENFKHPLKSIEEIEGVQQTLQTILKNLELWPNRISNGSIMMIEKFYQTSFELIPKNPSYLSAYSYKLFNRADFSMIEYSVGHSFDFIKGMKLIVSIFLTPQSPAPLKKLLGSIEIILQKEEFNLIEKNNTAAKLSIAQQLQLSHFLKYQFKRNMQELLNCYSQLDAWYGMALAVKDFHLNFPKLVEIDRPFLNAKGLYHIQLNNPIGYDVSLDDQSNFLFLTGANMAGKSTLIKSVGTAVFLAHIGMGVPAENMQLSLFDGMLSNINVMDNLLKGESYFYNEVHRIKSTVQRISDGKKWLILIDELFKGTNVEDAMKCSTTVIKGLLKIKKSLFILSTHLYEIGDELKSFPNIRFNYFETIVKEDQLFFNYQLKEGISNDRLGYFILKNEGVVELLEKL